jgi:hypothetical protein
LLDIHNPPLRSAAKSTALVALRPRIASDDGDFEDPFPLTSRSMAEFYDARQGIGIPSASVMPLAHVLHRRRLAI